MSPLHRHNRRLGILSLFLFLVVLIAFPQSVERKIKQKDLPASVLASFRAAYPTAVIKGASSEEENGVVLYEIESAVGSIHRDLLYAADGTVKEIEESVPRSAVPAAVRASLEKSFPGAQVKTSERLTKGIHVLYEFTLKTGTTTKEVQIDPKGTIVKGMPEGEKGRDEGNDDDDD